MKLQNLAPLLFLILFVSSAIQAFTPAHVSPIRAERLGAEYTRYTATITLNDQNFLYKNWTKDSNCGKFQNYTDDGYLETSGIKYISGIVEISVIWVHHGGNEGCSQYYELPTYGEGEAYFPGTITLITDFYEGSRQTCVYDKGSQEGYGTPCIITAASLEDQKKTTITVTPPSTREKPSTTPTPTLSLPPVDLRFPGESNPSIKPKEPVTVGDLPLVNLSFPSTTPNPPSILDDLPKFKPSKLVKQPNERQASISILEDLTPLNPRELIVPDNVKQSTGIEKIIVEVKTGVNASEGETIKITPIEKLPEKNKDGKIIPPLPSIFEPGVEEFFEIEISPYFASKISGAQVQFTVNNNQKAYLQLSLKPTLVRLETPIDISNELEWKELETIDLGNGKYKAKTPGFSFFAVAGKKEVKQSETSELLMLAGLIAAIFIGYTLLFAKKKEKTA